MHIDHRRSLDSSLRAGRRPASHNRRVVLSLSSAIFAVLAGVSALAADSGSYKTKDGIAVYLGVLPAAMVRGHPKDHPESAMHDGVPRGRDAYHVIAAVFDAASGKRVENANVEARVSPIGLAGVARTLEPMQIAGTVTYGNYFTIQSNEPYRILISIARGGETKPITLEFSHEHRTH
jgi:hypothetical protein